MKCRSTYSALSEAVTEVEPGTGRGGHGQGQKVEEEEERMRRMRTSSKIEIIYTLSVNAAVNARRLGLRYDWFGAVKHDPVS